MVGHKTESIYRRYAIVDEQMHREAAAKLDTWHLEQQAKAEAAAGHGVKTVLAAHRHELLHRRAMRGRFLQQRRIGGHGLRQRMQQEFDRKRIGGRWR